MFDYQKTRIFALWKPPLQEYSGTLTVYKNFTLFKWSFEVDNVAVVIVTVILAIVILSCRWLFFYTASDFSVFCLWWLYCFCYGT